MEWIVYINFKLQSRYKFLNLVCFNLALCLQKGRSIVKGIYIVRCAETYSRPDTPPSVKCFPQTLSLSLLSPPLPDVVIHLKRIHHQLKLKR